MGERVHAHVASGVELVDDDLVGIWVPEASTESLVASSRAIRSSRPRRES
jgi:hypothetical protein